MAKQSPPSPEQAKTAAAEQLWLLYYNNTLYEQGLITERDRNRMIHLIRNRRPGSTAKKR